VLGTFSLTTQGIEGGLLVMVNHGITTGALFLLVGMIYERRHTRQISELSGLQKSAPILAGVFMLVMLASVGLPGLNGFPGEFLSLLGAFEGARWWGVAAVTGVILAALYMLWAYQRVFHGPASGDNARMRDMRPAEFLVMLPLLALIVFLGLYPTPMLERMEPSVKALVEHVDLNVDRLTVDEVEYIGPAQAQGEEGE
jgi:NADH-quinone oxidoreductase subunit M